MTIDSDEYGHIVNRLLGSSFERSLAANSLKLRFGTRGGDPKGTHYIWIDPPWEFHGPDGFLTNSCYPGDEHFSAWSELFGPIDASVLEKWNVPEEGGAEFCFSGGYRLILAPGCESRDEDDWFGHWYAADRTA